MITAARMNKCEIHACADIVFDNERVARCNEKKKRKKKMSYVMIA